MLQICEKMTGNDPKLDLVNINAFIKFDQVMSICSKDIERKRLRAITCYKFVKNDK